MIFGFEDLPDIVTVKQLADYFNTSGQTISRALKNSELKGFKVGREWRISKEAVLQWVKRNSEAKENG